MEGNTILQWVDAGVSIFILLLFVTDKLISTKRADRTIELIREESDKRFDQMINAIKHVGTSMGIEVTKGIEEAIKTGVEKGIIEATLIINQKK